LRCTPFRKEVDKYFTLGQEKNERIYSFHNDRMLPISEGIEPVKELNEISLGRGGERGEELL